MITKSIQISTQPLLGLRPVKTISECHSWLSECDIVKAAEQAFRLATSHMLHTDFLADVVAAGGTAKFFDEDGEPILDRSYFLDEVVRGFALQIGAHAELLGVPSSDEIRVHFSGLTESAGEMLNRIAPVQTSTTVFER